MIERAVPSSWRLVYFVFAIAVSLSPFSAAGHGQTQRKYPGRGAVSAQDLSKLISPAAIGTIAADQVCARYTTGSTVSDPPVLQSQNGVLEVTMKFQTVTDAQGLARYCYVTDAGLEAPTLVVNPGDNLIIHFQNNLPTATASSSAGGMMGEIQVLPPGLAARAVVSASASSIAPNQNVTLTANVVDANTGAPAPTGLVQFQLNGENVGDPTAVANGVATLTTQVDGNVGSNNLTALYEGDTTYAEVTSPSIPITVSPFGLTSSGVTAAVGSAAITTIDVNIANNYATLVTLSCALPSNLTEGACFVNPGSMAGTGTVQLTVNTTPAHPISSKVNSRPGWLMAGGGACFCSFRDARNATRLYW